jgi:hypothetical protein
MTLYAPDVRAEITPALAPVYNALIQQTANGVTEQAPDAAHAFLCALPKIRNDLWLSRVIGLAAQCKQLDLNAISRLHWPGPLSAIQLHDIFARRLRFNQCLPYQADIVMAAQQANVGLEELALPSLRTLLLEQNQLNAAQCAFVNKRYATNVREARNGGEGIWLGARATTKPIAYALEAIIHNAPADLEQVRLVLLAPDTQINASILAAAKKFPRAVMVQYQSEAELVQRLRDLNMRVFIEMHGLQNPSTFIDSLRFGVADVQLTWAGLPESCPVPFMDGQLLDPVLAQASHVSCRAIPLRTWLPPLASVPRIERGESLGIWASSAKITATLLNRCAELAQRAGRRVQIFTGHPNTQMGDLPAQVELVDTLAAFRPAVLLDTMPISGGNACLIVLQNGIPVVTLPGASVSSRLGASILLNYGFPEGVARNQEDYDALALAFCALQSLPRIPKTIPWELADTVNRFFV